MKAHFLADQLTPISAIEALESMRAAVRTVTGAEPTAATVALLCAQWALETGRGKSCHLYNIGNEKATEDYVGYYTSFRCNEIENGKVVWYSPPNPACNFRAFLSALDGFIDHVRFLSQSKRYAEAWKCALQGDPGAFVQALKRAWYFTASLGPYMAAVSSLFREYLSLLGHLEQQADDAANHEPDPEHSTLTLHDIAEHSLDVFPLELTEADWAAMRAERDAAVTSDTQPEMPAVSENS